MIKENTLVLVTILFRHGDRIPDIHNIPPINPYTNHSFFPYQLGEVTHKGQERIIEIGRKLKERYKEFLGDEFYTSMVCSTTSSYSRCQMSLQCMHAGLFPPNQTHHMSLNWQAVPFHIIPFDVDQYISFHIHSPEAMRNIDPDIISPEDYQVIKYICEQTGLQNYEYIAAMRVYDYFKTCLEQGLELPDWIQSIWPEELETLAHKFWYYFQTKRRNFGAGMIRRITEEAKKKIDDSSNPYGTKMYLYAVHDMNLHLLRGALNNWTDEPIDYGAHLIFELHNINDIYGFKIFYQNNYETPKILKIPHYDEFISLSEFEAFTKKIHESN